MSKSKGKIKIIKDGPIIVKDVNNFKNAKNESINCKPLMSLCRCGGSKNKPYCDGTHINNGFNDNKAENRVKDLTKTFGGKNITIYDNRGVCSHRGFCVRELPEVFIKNGRPWINPDGASIDKIIEICEKCPSGALSYSLPGGERIKSLVGREEKLIISPREFDYDGPYEITGGIELDDCNDSKPETEEHYALCRCGASKNKPFCNGEHREIKFIDESVENE